MRIARTAQELRLDHGGKIGFVPTMGAFHEGHLSLMRKSNSECDTTVVSLFVNPTQFGKGEDYTRYPRNEEADANMAERAGASVLYVPTVEEVYGGSSTIVRVGGVSERWEGEKRPGHFDGVATVVAKLFQLVRPSIAYFGLKDYQQCRVIDRMVLDLFFPLKLSFEDTVREPDGLALSSRNTYLSPEDRAMAPMLYETLQQLARSVESGKEINCVREDSTSRLIGSGFDVEYLAVVDPESLEPVSTLCGTARALLAARLGSTRLIDNIAIGAQVAV